MSRCCLREHKCNWVFISIRIKKKQFTVVDLFINWGETVFRKNTIYYHDMDIIFMNIPGKKEKVICERSQILQHTFVFSDSSRALK